MKVRIDGFDGVSNVDDIKDIMGVTFDEDSISLSGDLSVSSNFRLDKKRRATVRNGQTQLYAGTDIKNFYVPPSGRVALFTDGIKIMSLDSGLTTATQLFSGITAKRRMAFAEHKNHIFMGDGISMKKYDLDREEITNWGIEEQTGSLTLTAGSNGNLQAGKYMYAITGVAKNGNETRPMFLAFIEATAGQSMVLSTIPTFSDSQVTSKRIWRTYGDPTIPFQFYYVAELPDATTTYTDYKPDSALGKELSTRRYFGPPLSSIILEYRARMYVAKRDRIFASEPELPEVFIRTQAWRAPDDITGLSSDDSGIYIHTLKETIPLRGLDYSDFQRGEPKPIGAMKFSTINPRGAPIWRNKDRWATVIQGSIGFLDADKHVREIADGADIVAGFDLKNEEVLEVINE